MADWWTCPSEGCNADTEVVKTTDRDGHEIERRCKECDWSVTIPTLEELEERYGEL